MSASIAAVVDRPHCLICGGTSAKPSLFGGHRYLGERYYRVRCTGCGFIYVAPTPAPAALKAMYNDEYFANYYGGGDDVGYESSAEAGMGRASHVLSLVAPYVPKGALLDIGCAGGHFLRVAKARGYECLGIELNPQMAAHARRAFGLEVLEGSYESVELERSGRRFDVIYMGDSLEHLPDPRRALDRVGGLLTPGGVFVLNGPLTLNRSLFTAVLRFKLLLGRGRTAWYVDEPPYHLWEWNATTMRRFLVANDFEVLEFATFEEPARPKDVLVEVLKRPLTFMERTALHLKDLSAWFTNTFCRRYNWGDRVIAICRRRLPASQ